MAQRWVFVVLAVAGCSGQNGSEGAPGPDAAARDTSVSDAGKPKSTTDAGSGARKDVTAPPHSDASGVDARPDDAPHASVDTGVDSGCRGQPRVDGAAPCAAGQSCVLATDCTTKVCNAGDPDSGATPVSCTAGAACVCQSATCTDGVQNGTETGVDCGGSCAGCGAGAACLLGASCASEVCNAGDPDAGPVSIDCPAGASCTCQKPVAYDGVKNDSETDVDCGGETLASGAKNPESDMAPVCQWRMNQHCLLGSDCDQKVCNANGAPGTGGGPINCASGSSACTCQPPFPDDGVQNDSETDVDCGGGSSPGSDGAPKCADKKACKIGLDCTSGVCNSGDPAKAPVPVDCAGAGPCSCQPGVPYDGVANGTETDVDCGGGAVVGSDNAPACADGKSCLVGTDCASSWCSLIDHTCVAGQSCTGPATAAVATEVDLAGVTEHGGIDTCGAGETDETNAHESCCRSLLLPDKSARVDKYEVTAGRMRQFVESIAQTTSPAGTKYPAYDVRDWVSDQIAAATPTGKVLAAQIPANVLGFLPHSGTSTEPLNIVTQLGGQSIDIMIPSNLQGCFNGDEDDGANTFWWPASRLTEQFGAAYFNPAHDYTERSYTQEQYDEKSLNCSPYWMYAAFCAWDGGSMPTDAQITAIWGAGSWPWASPGGVSSVPIPSAKNQFTNAIAQTIDNFDDEYAFYAYPAYPDSFNDEVAGYISAPGRYLLDKTANLSPSFTGTEGWHDVGANMMEMEASAGTGKGTGKFCDYTGILGPGDVLDATNCPAIKAMGPVGVLRSSTMSSIAWFGGSWEVHAIARTRSINIATQYGKAGFRCARPVE